MQAGRGGDSRRGKERVGVKDGSLPLQEGEVGREASCPSVRVGAVMQRQQQGQQRQR